MENTSNGKEIQVCPNCGRILQGPEYLISVNVMAQQVGLAFDPIAGRFLCPDCNYSGLPVSVKQKDYGRMKFENKKLDLPLAESNPVYWQTSLFSLALICLGVMLGDMITGKIIIIFGFLLLFYAAIKIPKYRHTTS